ncbi:hypothetical protein OIDMADRAFT_139712 [Oidiodendron maius Zn]|uniref:Nephrocystin 3-like N-terminal domain-containing protein n=1 Tax=Oidiodendron maius (strain Zn) TaxID=913774 RepID=A0A0C3D6P7_OIDMZ|nr:hypothetical protein OIDMADRAFT_139712 [Oidiodendron maius Zn]
MDPLSVTASTIAIASRVLNILGDIGAYGQRPKRFDSIRIEVLAVLEILRTISKHQFEQPGGESWEPYTHLFLSCSDVLQRILSEVERIVGKRNSVLRGFALIVTSERLDNLLGQLDRIQSGITSNDIDFLKNRVTDLEALNVEQVHRYAELVEESRNDILRSRVLDWISTYDVSASQSRADGYRLPGTCKWLLQTPEFSQWDTGTGRNVLIVSGSVGTGKSVLSSYIIQHLERSSKLHDDPRQIAFFPQSQSENLTARQVLLNLLRQLLEDHVILPPWITHHFSRARKSAFNILDIKQAFKVALQSLQPTFVIDEIDAVDNWPEIFDFFSELGQSSEPGLRLQLLVFNRPNWLLEEKLKSTPHICVNIAKSNSVDIDRFVKSKIGAIDHIARRPDLQDRLVSSILPRAEGCFLWVASVVAEIRHSKSSQAMRAAVEELPQTMAATYDLLARDMDQTDRAAMLFISLAPRRLTVGELENIVAVWFKDTEPEDRWDFRPNNFLECKSNTNTVSFTHFSVQQWILSKVDPDSAAAVSKTLGTFVPVHNAPVPSTVFVPEKNEPSYYQDDESLGTQFAELFQEQAELRVLTLEFLKVRGRYGFEEMFTSLLKVYSAALIPIAPSTTARVAALLAGDKAAQISSALTKASGYLDGSLTATRRDSQGKGAAKDSGFLMDKFFESLHIPAEERTPSSTSYDPDSQVATPTKPQHSVIGNIERLTVPVRALVVKEAPASEEFADGLYINLSGVKVWLVTAPPFVQMLNQLAEKLNPSKTLPHIPKVATATIKATSKSGLKVFLGIVFRFLLFVIPGGEEPLSDGFKRVRWTCFCGRRLYDDFCEVIPGSVSNIQAALNSAYRPHKATSMSDGKISRAPIMRHSVYVAFLAVLISLSPVSPIKRLWAGIAAILVYGCVLSIIAAVFGVLLILLYQNWSESRSHPGSSLDAAWTEANSPLHDKDDMNEADSGRERNIANKGTAEHGEQHVRRRSSAPSATAAASASRGQPTTHAGPSSQREVVSSHGRDSGSESDSRRRHRSSGKHGKRLTKDSNSSHGEDSEEENGQRHGVELERRQAPDERRWILALFENNERDDIYVYLNARIRNCDFVLFKGLKQKYHQISSRWSRFWQLKQVQALRVVQFNIADERRGDIIQKDVWPPEHDPQMWYYIPYPAKETIPPVGSRHLLSVWRDLHHADRAAYAEYLAGATRFERLLDWARDVPHIFWQDVHDRIRGFGRAHGLLDDEDDAAVELSNALPDLMHAHDIEQPHRQARTRYIHARLPKRAGAKTAVTWRDTDAPEAWGVLFEEAFHVHRLLFFLLIIYSAFSLVMVVWLLKTYGLNLPSSSVGVACMSGMV